MHTFTLRNTFSHGREAGAGARAGWAHLRDGSGSGVLAGDGGHVQEGNPEPRERSARTLQVRMRFDCNV
eukprot:6194354-Pleurochrysis_carterae.AAC.4